MWDGGVNHLEVQPLSPLTSPLEMNESLTNVLLKLNRNVEYKTLFAQAFHDSIITSDKMLKALVQFTGLMVSANSRYDKFIARKDTFSTAEKRGLTLFRSNCSSCHTEPLFTNNSYKNNGLKPDTALNDKGWALITGLSTDFNMFKVPSL